LKERALHARDFQDDGMAKSNVEIVQAVYAAFGRRDKIALAMLIAGDIEIVQSTALPWGGEYHGFAGLKQFFETLLTHVDSQVEFERMIDAGDQVAAVGWVSGTVRANGREFRIPIVHLWKIRDGRAAAFHPYIENALMLEALAGA